MSIRSPDRGKPSKQRIWGYLLAAAVLHVAFLAAVGPWLRPGAKAKPTKVTIVSFPKDGAERRARRDVNRPQRDIEVQAQAKKEQAKDNEKLDGQVVDVPPSPDDRPPERYDYLSEHNTRTERETVSRHQQKDYGTAMNELSTNQPQKPSTPEAPRQAQSVEIGPADPKKADSKDGSQNVFELPRVRKRDRLALDLDPSLGTLRNQRQSEALEGNSDRLKLSLGDTPDPGQKGTAPTQGPSTLELVPSVGVLAALSGAPANDHLEGLEEGEGTFLNSREFKFASFFNRMKRGVSEHWKPLVEYRRRDPTGNVYGHRSRVTVLRVVLNATGSIEEIEVSRSSGVDFLDNEAVAAFRRAEPFPNPPKGLVDKDTGKIDFPFGFHIEFSNRGGLQLPF